MITGKELVEKMYSENYDEYEEDIRLYSTGDDELDDLLEKAFSEGYEYAQKEFAGARGITGSDISLSQNYHYTRWGKAGQLADRTNKQMLNIGKLSQGKKLSPKRKELIDKALQNRAVLIHDLSSDGQSSPAILKHALPYKGVSYLDNH